MYFVPIFVHFVPNYTVRQKKYVIVISNKRVDFMDYIVDKITNYFLKAKYISEEKKKYTVTVLNLSFRIL